MQRTVHEAYKTDRTEMVYGEEMPVWVFQHEWHCGCVSAPGEIASHTPIANVVLLLDCPEHRDPNQSGFNVWD